MSDMEDLSMICVSMKLLLSMEQIEHDYLICILSYNFLCWLGL